MDPLLVVIAGPTASGKSGLALELAEEFRARGREAEILCADSVTVYRGFDIGAAKPTLEERARVPHHLLDVADPAENFTAGDFTRLAAPIVISLQARGAVPIVAGGTGFYLRALLRGMASGEENAERAARVKEALLARAAQEGYPALHAELLRRDPGSAPVIHPHDHYRIVRALQAMELTGARWSELNRVARAAPPAFPGLRFFALEWKKESLAERIGRRAAEMVRGGLLAEVEKLRAAGVPASARAFGSVGYAEALACLEGRLPKDELTEAIAASTRRLAKSQGTWFRREELAEPLRRPHREALREALGLD